MRTARAVAVASGVLTVVISMPGTSGAQVVQDPGTPPVREISTRLVPDADQPVPMPHLRNLGARPVPMPLVQPQGAVAPMPRVGAPPAGVLLVPPASPAGAESPELVR